MSDDDPATKGDLKQLRAEMATKDDLKQLRAEMATKDDLKALETTLRAEMATKDDLKTLETTLRAEMATKEDLASMEVRLSNRIDVSITDVANRLIEVIRQESARTANSMEEAFQARYGPLDDKHTHRADRLQEQLDSHAQDPDAHRRG